MDAKKVIIIGASSGIGEALAKNFSQNGHIVGMTARRTDRLELLQKSLPGRSFIKFMDVSNYDDARKRLREMINEMGGMDIIVLNAGYGVFKRDWETEKNIIQVNVGGFVALANLSYKYFVEKGRGQIVGMSSISAVRGHRKLTAYAASKAFISHYMEGLRLQLIKNHIPVKVTDIKAGYIDTAMTRGNKGMFWVAPVEKAAQQMYLAIIAGKNNVYVTKRWRLVALLMKHVPSRLYLKMS